MTLSKSLLSTFYLTTITFLSCSQPEKNVPHVEKMVEEIKVGADKTVDYFPVLKGKRVAVVANQSSRIGTTHLVDSLVSAGITIQKVFSPEHGFRGVVDAGEKVNSSIDTKTGLAIVSLYGKHKKPTPQDLADVDVVVFDIQDVGVRFYTYLSTMHYVMEACAENGKKMIVLDRPNPNGFYVDGPVLDTNYKSFLGLHPVPLVYGLTIGEYANMINGEKWLSGGVTCNLTVISLQGYTHSDWYQLPVRPSPNLPNMTAVYLYPSLGLFEGTVVSAGRGTDLPFQSIGHPSFDSLKASGDKNYFFVPEERLGAKYPKFKGVKCYGYDLRGFDDLFIKPMKQVYLLWLQGMYSALPNKKTFFTRNFNAHAGNATLQQQIKEGLSYTAIRESWQPDLDAFKRIRKKYLLYSDFE